jgi:hypothetical protein
VKYETDFSGWLDQLPELDNDDVFALYMTITTKEDWEPFEIESKCNNCERYSIKHDDGGEAVTIANQSSADTLLSMASDKYCDGEDIDSWYRPIWNEN